MAYLCLRCNAIHGWDDHPRVQKVERHFREEFEDIWYCPKCGKQHRTTDGTLLGQLYKEWREFDLNNEPIEEGPFIFMPNGQIFIKHA